MIGERASLLLTSLGLVAIAGCFTGEAALGLPCTDDLGCGDGQECVQGVCSRPGGPAEGSCGDGVVNAGESCDSEDRELCTADCRAVFFHDQVEVGINGWTHEIVSRPPDDDCLSTIFCFEDDWERTSAIPAIRSGGEGGLFAWYSGNLARVRGPGSTRLISPEIDLSEAVAPIVLRFDHYYAFKAYLGEDGSDGAIVEVSRDGGAFEQLQLSSYTGMISDERKCQAGTPPTQNPLLGRAAFIGRSETWSPATGSLDAYAGSKIRLGFHIGSDCASLAFAWFDGGAEWYLDNFVVSGERSSQP
jgi:hypothetical protein